MFHGPLKYQADSQRHGPCSRHDPMGAIMAHVFLHIYLMLSKQRLCNPDQLCYFLQGKGVVASVKWLSG